MFPSFYCFDCEYVCVSYTCFLSFCFVCPFCLFSEEREKEMVQNFVGGRVGRIWEELQ